MLDTQDFFRLSTMHPPKNKLYADVFARIQSDFAASLAFDTIGHGIAPTQEVTPSIESLYVAFSGLSNKMFQRTLGGREWYVQCECLASKAR